jgi:hypothetical protein
MKNKVLPTFIATCVLILLLSINAIGLMKAFFFVGLYFFLYYETLMGEKSSYSIWLSALLKAHCCYGCRLHNVRKELGVWVIHLLSHPLYLSVGITFTYPLQTK